MYDSVEFECEHLGTHVFSSSSIFSSRFIVLCMNFFAFDLVSWCSEPAIQNKLKLLLVH